MINSLKILEVVTTVVVLISLGFFAKKTGIAKKEHSKVLNNIIIYLTLPPLIFMAIKKATLTTGLIGIPVIALLTIAIVLLLAFIIGRFMGFDSKLFGSFLLVAAIGNTGYLGYPLALHLAGDKGLTQAIFYDVFGTVLIMFTIGLYIAKIYGVHKGKINVLKELFTFPPFVAALLAFALKPLIIPVFIGTILTTLAGATVPLIMISVGLSLEVKAVGKYIVPIAIAFFLKLIVSPLIAYSFSRMAISQSNIPITVMEAAMPPALLSLVIGLKYELDNDFLASVIFALTVASVITIPLVLIPLFR